MAEQTSTPKPARTPKAAGAAAGKAAGHDTPRQAAQAAVDSAKRQLRLPLLGSVALPPPDHMAWYGGVVALAAFELIEWPVALVLALGKVLADNRSNKTIQAFGEALEDAG